MGAKVLVVDDNVPSGQTLALAMQLSGHDVRFVTDGESALREVQAFIPDVVLCDINMPGMLGYEVCRKMRADARLQDTLFLAQTALSTHEKKEQSLEAGFHYHLVKPVNLEKLTDILELDLARRQAAPQLAS